MWFTYVLLSVILSNFVCRSVSAQQRVYPIDVNGATPSSRTKNPNTAEQLEHIVWLGDYRLLYDNRGKHSIRKRANSVPTSGRRSPLLEVMLRILDTIQLVPKKRSRRAAARMLKLKSLSRDQQTLPKSLDPNKAPVFFNDRLQPLMVSSLEQTLDNVMADSNEKRLDSQSKEFEEANSDESHVAHLRQNGSNDEDSNERLYDLLLKILKVLDDQAYRDAERNRRLEQLRNLGAVSLERQSEMDDSSLETFDGSWMETHVQ